MFLKELRELIDKYENIKELGVNEEEVVMINFINSYIDEVAVEKDDYFDDFYE